MNKLTKKGEKMKVRCVIDCDAWGDSDFISEGEVWEATEVGEECVRLIKPNGGDRVRVRPEVFVAAFREELS